jgi:hypothetical protein
MNSDMENHDMANETNSNSTEGGKEFENEKRYQEVDNAIVELIQQAKSRPLPKSTKVLAVCAIFALIFTGGAVFGKAKATPSVGTGLSLAGFSGAGGGFGGAGGFGGNGSGRRNGGAGAGAGFATGGGSPFVSGAPAPAAPVITVALPNDVAGTLVSISATEIVVETLSGEKVTYPISAATKVRESSKGSLAGLKAGDVITIKPDTDKSAKTITLLK